MQPFTEVDVVRVENGARAAARDLAAAEEPLEVRVEGEPFAVIMRTPGSDMELAAGFLLAERVVREPDDLAGIDHCRDAGVDPEARGNIVNVRLGERAAARLPLLLADRRQVLATSACGLCGRRTIASLTAEAPPVTERWTLASDAIADLPARLRERQQAFGETGGVHAAALFDPSGKLQGIAEDVGRHNAVDKVIGRMLLLERFPLGDCALVVSGRSSFEIVQKALIAGVPLVAAVSAPSSLAIELAREGGITLLGFVRDGRFNIYTHPHRIAE